MNDLAGNQDPSDRVFTSNIHYHGSHAPGLSQGDNVYVELEPGDSMDVTIPISTHDNTSGVNWYPPHVHEVTTEQVEGVRVAVGFVAPSTVPSHKPNLITTPERGMNAGTVSVWNIEDICQCSTHGGH